VTAGEDAQLLVGTTAAEKIYRSLGPARLSPSGSRWRWAAAALLPQETILFDAGAWPAASRSRWRRALPSSSPRALCSAAPHGRGGRTRGCRRRWRVRRGGQLVFAESLRLDGPIARRLAEPAVAGGGCAVATVLRVPGDDRQVAAVRAKDFSGGVGLSCWNGVTVARLCARDGAVLRRDLAAVLAALDTGPLPKLWVD